MSRRLLGADCGHRRRAWSSCRGRDGDDVAVVNIIVACALE